MGSWIWVISGVAQPPPKQLPETDPSVPEKGHWSAVDETDAAAEGAIGDPQTIPVPNPEPGDTSVIKINILGPVVVDPELAPPKRHVLLELACYLALHRRRPVITEELQIALSGDDDGPETSAKSVRTYMSELRHWIGAEHVPSARGSGYRLAESVTSDWDEFRALAQQRSEDHYEQLRLLSEALNLVRGRPFAGTNYRWVDAELLVSEIEVAISDVARRLGALASAQGAAAIVWFAGRRAVLACPYDIGLWEMALEGAAGYDPTELERSWRDAQVALGDEAAALREVANRLGLT
jgi:hypothetical protein